MKPIRLNHTLGSLKEDLTLQLAALGGSQAQTAAEIRLIFEALLNVPWEAVYRNPDQPVALHQCEQVEALLARRLQQRIPIQYLLGEANFYGLRFHVSPGVLIPRPETELLVEKAIVLCGERGYQRVLDLGTGSGAIAIALAKQLGEAVHVTATDISPAALGIAQENARMLGACVRFCYGDLWEPLAGERFDLIVSNPPYIDPALRETLAPEVREHEPPEALFADKGGFAFYERIAQGAPQVLTPGGAVLVELGDGMAEKVARMFEATGFHDIGFVQDYAGISRHCFGFL